MDPGTTMGAEIRLNIIQVSKNRVIKIYLNYETLYEYLQGILRRKEY